ncbi:MAG: hypothetical protein GX429_03185 [Bacteroidales bacterium]|nr:hypothetical protein [Bacteroidales bacterium]
MKISHISKKEILNGEEIKGEDIREGVFNLIQSEYPNFTKECYISLAELNHFRRLYLTSIMFQEKEALNILDRDVIEAIKNNAILSENIQDEIESKITFGQKIANRVACKLPRNPLPPKMENRQ